MKIIRLLGALAVFSLMIAPALSEHAAKTCTCTQGGCHSSTGMNCCGKLPEESCLSQTCACSSQISPSSGVEVYDPGNSYFGKGSSRSYTRQSSSSSLSEPGYTSTFSGPNPANSNNGPPDLDVVEYLPPSAKQIFDILATNGPLTQKDLISKTDLPPRTVRYALSRLKGEDILKERFCFQDARQSLYSLANTGLK
jgi:DNA-binding transcriptional ArsR family regulator